MGELERLVIAVICNLQLKNHLDLKSWQSQILAIANQETGPPFFLCPSA
jgi:hypothetical protein